MEIVENMRQALHCKLVSLDLFLLLRSNTRMGHCASKHCKSPLYLLNVYICQLVQRMHIV